MKQNRKTASIMLVAFLFLGLARAQAAKIEVECPEEVKSRQAPVPMKGWASHVETVNTRQLFTGLSLYSGHPKDGVILFADETSAPPAVAGSGTAEAPAQAGTPYKIPAGKEGFVVCQYTNTLVRLIKKLPKDIQVCHVKFSETLGHVQKAVCD